MKMTRLRNALRLITMVAITTPGIAADLSPARWPDAERLQLERREAAIWPTENRSANSARGLVTGTASPIAVHAGADERAELVPAGRYPSELLATLGTRGLRVQEANAQRTLTLRGTAVVGIVRPDGERQGTEVPHVMGFAEEE